MVRHQNQRFVTFVLECFGHEQMQRLCAGFGFGHVIEKRSQRGLNFEAPELHQLGSVFAAAPRAAVHISSSYTLFAQPFAQTHRLLATFLAQIALRAAICQRVVCRVTHARC